MYSVVIMALFASIGTWLLTALGAMSVVFFKTPSQKLMNLLLGFAAGVMIAASFWSLLEPAIERAELHLRTPAYFVVTVGFILGAVFMWVSDKIVTYSQSRMGRDSEKKTKTSRVIMLFLSITLHNIPEGLAVGVAFGTLGRSGYTTEALMGAITIAVGIGLQNFPEGAAVSLPLRREGFSRKKSFFVGQASAMVEPLAALVGAILVVYVEGVLAYALAFAAGAMILVAVHELIPECQQNKSASPYFATMGIVSGFAIMMLLDVMLG